MLHQETETSDAPSQSASDVAYLLSLDQCDYKDALELQQRIQRKRQEGAIPDVVIMLQHKPCVTIGSSGGDDHILVDPAVLERHGVAVHKTDRGGDVTYHGPGQLVCYSIMALDGAWRDLHRYARSLEEVMIRTVAAFGVSAGRKKEYPGVWVGDRKIGAMGVSVRKWVAMHGISLNVCPDMEHFSFIVPCGIEAYGVTSMAETLGRNLDIADVRAEMQRQFAAVFQKNLHVVDLKRLSEELQDEEA
ncbi:MAG: lipoyl(octanoyl) transferase LipB [Desulfovibrionaceae bacterium]